MVGNDFICLSSRDQSDYIGKESRFWKACITYIVYKFSRSVYKDFSCQKYTCVFIEVG